MTDRKPIALIVNPTAGKKQGRQIGAMAASRLQGAGLAVEIMESSGHGQMGTIAETLKQEDWGGIIAVGGDGSLFEIVNGLYKTGSGISTVIGQIPSGTGNSYLRDINIFTVENSVEAIISNRSQSVDLAQFSCSEGEYRFINLLGVGFVANVAKRAGKYKIFGSKSYIFGVLEEVIQLNPVPIRLKIDDQIIERTAIFVEICNSRFTGGNMLMAPSARIDDGLLEVIIVNHCSRRRILTLLPTIFTGTHVNEPEVEVFRGENISLDSEHSLALNADGEVFGNTPIRARICSRELQIFTGKKIT